MSVTLCGTEGELVSVRVTVDPRALEDLLEAIAGFPFPVNPQIIHGQAETAVEFPAWNNRIPEIHRLLEGRGFPAARVTVHPVLEVA